MISIILAQILTLYLPNPIRFIIIGKIVRSHYFLNFF